MSLTASPAATGAGLHAGPPASPPGPGRLGHLAAEGVAIWLDDISRDRLASGNLAELARTRHITGVTSNPTIFANALSNGTASDSSAAGSAGADGPGPKVTGTELTHHEYAAPPPGRHGRRSPGQPGDLAFLGR